MAVLSLCGQSIQRVSLLFQGIVIRVLERRPSSLFVRIPSIIGYISLHLNVIHRGGGQFTFFTTTLDVRFFFTVPYLWEPLVSRFELSDSFYDAVRPLSSCWNFSSYIMHVGKWR